MNSKLSNNRAAVYHLGAVNLDHCPMLIDTNPADCEVPRPFRFEAMWTKDPRCFEMVDEAWKMDFVGSACYNLYRKQFNTTSALRRWNKEVFGHCQSRISELMGSIEKI